MRPDRRSVADRQCLAQTILTRDAQRTAARLLGEWRQNDTTLRAGLTFAQDDLATGETNRSTLVQLGATQRLLENRLELDAQTEFALNNNDDSVDFPARHRLGARYNLTSAVALVGAYEIADGGSVRRAPRGSASTRGRGMAAGSSPAAANRTSPNMGRDPSPPMA